MSVVAGGTGHGRGSVVSVVGWASVAHCMAGGQMVGELAGVRLAENLSVRKVGGH